MQLDRDTIVRLGDKVAPAAATFARLRVLLQDSGVGTEDIVQLLRLDPALTFQVVRLSNSILFGVRDRRDSIEAAVGRIGFGEVYRLVGLAATRQICQDDLPSYRLKAVRLWENSVATAAAAEVLATSAQRDPEEAYTGGLLRTLGRVVLDGASRGRIYPGEAEWPEVSEWEKSTYGVTAAETTAILLEHWKFSRDIVSSVRSHLDPFGAKESNRGACILNLACGVATRFGLDLPGEQAHWNSSPAKLMLANVTANVLEECGLRARQHYAALCTSVK
jgi:HD-like signal output (HDOD) protein